MDEVVFGAANEAGEGNRNVARMAALRAGVARRDIGNHSELGVGVSMDAVPHASWLIETGDAAVVTAAGMPSVAPKLPRGFPVGNEMPHSITLGLRLW